jgi:hypothetical protein
VEKDLIPVFTTAYYLGGWKCVLASPCEMETSGAAYHLVASQGTRRSSERGTKRKRCEEHLPRTIFVSPDGKVSFARISLLFRLEMFS